jgi:pimeloyl-ACP methyl ester carboxylesterase
VIPTLRAIDRIRVTALVVLASCAALSAVARAEAVASGRAPALLMNLDEFDKAKQTVLLPNGITLGYVEFGDPAGPPMVLIHGYTDSARDWVPLVPYLPKGSRLILVDIRGHGVSSKPECCYSRVDFAYDIKLLLDTLGVERADIVGHSLGSIISQTFAEFWPERTRKVVLISSTGGPAKCTAPGAAPPKPAGMDFRSEILKLHEPIDPESKFMIDWWASPTPVDPDFLRRQRRDAAQIPLKVWFAVLDQGLTGMDLQSTLPRLKAPTLLIWGAKDPIFGPEDRRTLQKGLPTAKVIVYPEFGHNSFWEDPKRVARDLSEFLAE